MVFDLPTLNFLYAGTVVEMVDASSGAMKEPNHEKKCNSHYPQ